MNLFIDYFSILTTIIELFLEFYFFTKFLHKRIKVYHYFIFIFISIIFLNVISVPIFWKFILYILLLTSYGWFIYKVQNSIVILYAIITVEIMMLCYGISNSVTGFLSSYFYALNPFITGQMFMILGAFLSFFLAYLCYFLIHKYFVCFNIQENVYILMILIPLLMIFLINEYINNTIYSNTIKASNNTIILSSNIQHINYIQLLMIQMIGMISLFCIVYAYKKLIHSFQLNMKLSILEQEAHFQNQYVQEAKERYEKTQSIRHDLKNHLTIVQGFLEKDNVEQAQKYLYDIEILASDLSFSCHTNNPVLDILIENKLGLAKNKNIDISCFLKLPYPCSIPDIDFCIILSNALDNAISACEKVSNTHKKYIEISGKKQGDFFLIEVKNSYNNNSCYKEGIGLSNIKAVAEKYNGTIHIHTENTCFCLTVLLIIPLQPECISQQIY